MELVKIESPSRQEGMIAEFIKTWFKENVPGVCVLEDNSQMDTGSNTGNLIIKLPGDIHAPSIFFNAHMDTVEPCRNIRPVFENGIFRSDGTTILGSDDKAAIAIMMEMTLCLKEQNIKHGPFEFLLTTCEEIGLLGAKALDASLVESKAGLALDTEDPDSVINRAPAAIRFHVKINGIAAHAGLNPEEGISAIKIAANAIENTPQGRIDNETTCNIGLIKGGTATNIVPDLVQVDGEVRSHNEDRLREIQDKIIACFYDATKRFKKDSPDPYPYASATVENDYPLMNVPEGHPLSQTLIEAGKRLGRNLKIERTGGGSDANIFNKKGLTTLIVGIGMQKVHTTEEFIRLEDMVKSCRLMIEVLKAWRKLTRP